MYNARLTFAAALFAAALLAAPAARAQQPSPQRPAGGRPAPQQQQAAPAAQPVPDGKVALISTLTFADPKEGVARFVAVTRTVEREFEPSRAEVRQLKARYDQLAKDLSNAGAVSDQAALARKAEEAESLKTQIARKVEDGQARFERRMKEALAPVQQDVFRALEAYARERGISVIIDASQVPILYGAAGTNITGDFIRTYNQRNPATASAPSAGPASGARP
jgi:outer membrane protein